jgi:hypothetical protein
MLEQLSVIFSEHEWQPAAPQRGTIASEFPSIFVNYQPMHELDGAPHLNASEWDRPDFDAFAFDWRIDELSAEPFTLRIIEDEGSRTHFPLEVLNRCQRLIDRRNKHSQGKIFDRVLRRHRELHDLGKPLVHADYNHALDAWQWVLRLDANATAPLQYAALFHDVERLVSEPDSRHEHLAADYQTFKDEHAREGGAMTARILAECGVPEPLRARAAQLVSEHERQSDDADLALLNDADALSFFSLNSSGYADYFGAEQTKKKVEYTWNRLRPQSRAKLAHVHLRPDVRAMMPAAD